MIHSSIPRRGLMLLISSPSGAGKTSLSRRLVADHAELELSISATTRDPRPGEEDGREYHFIDRPTFDEMVATNAFLEWANVHEHRYGSPQQPVMDALGGGRDMLFDIDWQGAAQIAGKAPDDVVRVFILPPSMAELSRRLHARAQDREDVIQRRLGRAYGEIERAVDYDYVIINDDYDRAYSDLAHIYHAERQKRVRNPGLADLIQQLLDERLP
ncbi:MAG: guanylate kinase [Phenylobacterium sp.]|uniref:guanylate kinase n=1 Tax=Phenylobacterium sp. TaxID=1871053 RepID=UPI002722A0BC|nr:guanylate kinase [Phenylobacterium sp.]MDO8899918.1 guanylate kinase [Phenylobacterium sp.]